MNNKQSIKQMQMERNGIIEIRLGGIFLYYKKDDPTGIIYDYPTCDEIDKTTTYELRIYLSWALGDADLLTSISLLYMMSLLDKFDENPIVTLTTVKRLQRLADKHIEELFNT